MEKIDEQQIKTFSTSASNQKAESSYSLRSFGNSIQLFLGFTSRFRKRKIFEQRDRLTCSTKSKRTPSIEQSENGGVCEKSECENKSKKFFGGVPMRTHFYMQPPLLHYKKQTLVDRILSLVMGE
ncbi:hypothetical protein JWG40_03780 [Leptospira sp. 201903074]|uniref:hypothetical protein n=1 Tax=Leptospira abararensis TaxID=2810036 RepID=UPI001962F7E3|nr:hypothetical protein [Leptospira abararensis]MBM9546120.1 hypothetical protein [Leptospira abararensis]